MRTTKAIAGAKIILGGCRLFTRYLEAKRRRERDVGEKEEKVERDMPQDASGSLAVILDLQQFAAA